MTTDLDTETTIEEPTLRIVRVASCPSLSNRSQLTYHIGCGKANGVCFRLWSNSGKGMLSRMWVSMTDISKQLATVTPKDAITSAALLPLCVGVSVNNAGFWLAILLNGEGLLERAKDNQRNYRCVDPKPFLDRIKALTASDVTLKEDDAPSDAEPPVPAHTTAVVPKRGKAKKQGQ